MHAQHSHNHIDTRHQPPRVLVIWILWCLIYIKTMVKNQKLNLVLSFLPTPKYLMQVKWKLCYIMSNRDIQNSWGRWNRSFLSWFATMTLQVLADILSPFSRDLLTLTEEFWFGKWNYFLLVFRDPDSILLYSLRSSS